MRHRRLPLLDQANSQTLAQKISYYQWPIGIVLFFMLLAVLNGHLAWVALSNSQDIIEESPYEKGIQYQQVVDQLSLSKTLGLQVQVQASVPGEQGIRSVNFQFTGSQTLLNVKSVEVRFYYPQTGRYDTTVKSHEVVAPNQFMLKATLPLQGLCFADILAQTPEGHALIKERIWLD